MLNLAQELIRPSDEAERNDEDGLVWYQAKAWEYATRAQSVSDPERKDGHAPVCGHVDESHGTDRRFPIGLRNVADGRTLRTQEFGTALA